MRPSGARLAIALALAGCSAGGERDLPPAYRALGVPEARLRAPEARARGRALFVTHCALCHGERADGRGARREGLSSSPRDFTDPAWARRTAPRRVFHAVREGLAGTAMPAWKALEDEEVWDLVAYLLSAAETARGTP